jgi:ankyrin repeat protein
MKDLVRAETKSGLTSLHVAALNGHFETVKFLVESAGAVSGFCMT